LNRQHHQFTVNAPERGQRLDLFVLERLPGHSRSGVHKLIREGCVRVNGKEVKSGYRIRALDKVDVAIPEPEHLDLSPWHHPLEFLHQDADIVVINKPPGMVVHPSPGHWSETMVHALLASVEDLSQIGGTIRPGIVHRLDKDTSGILLVAKNDGAHQELIRQFKSGAIEKTYLAIVAGRMDERSGVIEAPIGRHPVDRKKMSVHSKSGKRAVTLWRVEKEFGAGASLLQVEIKTGRTHQIRVHLALKNHPVLGDQKYGGKRASASFPEARNLQKLIGRQMLHAWKIGFIHPVSQQRISLQAPIPRDMLDVLAALEEKNNEKEPWVS
jgi:23S rRNA pseudouridine1911/1915/1917 synthase